MGAEAAPRYQKMNAVSAISFYVDKATGEVPGNKILLVDDETAVIMAMVKTFTEVMKQDIFLVEKLSQENRSKQTHMKALCLLRPTPKNLELLVKELREPKYEQYFLYFTNILSSDFLAELAAADQHEVVSAVEEVFADFYAYNTDLFSLSMGSTSSLLSQTSWRDDQFARLSDGLAAALLALKMSPVIRYQGSSEIARTLGQELTARIRGEQVLFHSGNEGSPPVLLILDRRLDPVTPLLTQWTYQAMIHEFLSIKHNRVKADFAGQKDEFVMAAQHDTIFRENMFNNFGDMTEVISQLGERWRQRSHRPGTVESFEDIKNILSQMPDMQREMGEAERHLMVFGQMQEIIDQRQLLTVSEVEQELVSKNDHAKGFQMVESLFRNPNVKRQDLVRVAMLYALHYHKDSKSRLSQVMRMLEERGVERDLQELVTTVLQYGGGPEMARDLFFGGGATSLFKKKPRKLKGVDSVYTQHEPYLTRVLEALGAGSLDSSDFPFTRESMASSRAPRDILVFFVGGATFEEALSVHRLNEEGSLRIVLGGTEIHNSFSFLEEATGTY